MPRQSIKRTSRQSGLAKQSPRARIGNRGRTFIHELSGIMMTFRGGFLEIVYSLAKNWFYVGLGFSEGRVYQQAARELVDCLRRFLTVAVMK